MEFITVPAVLTIIGYFIYKLFELFVCKKERLYMLEHAKEINLGDQKLPLLSTTGLNIHFSALKWGSFFLGVGLGILVAYVICISTMGWNVYEHNFYSNPVEIVFGGCIFLFGGLGLIVAFIIEMKMNRKQA